MLIALLTDFGLTDTFVGVMQAVILTIAPTARIIDLTHAIPPQDVAAGAWALATAFPYLPDDAIVVAVVDPGVGTDRRPVAAQLGGRIVVAPDNGLLTRVLAQQPASLAVVLDNPAMWLSRAGPTPSATFHGRDIFAPVAARLARNIPLTDIGSAIDPATLVRLTLPTPIISGDQITAHVIHVDHFGNLITDLGPDLIARIFAAQAIDAVIAGSPCRDRATTFGAGPVAAPFWYRDSSGHAAIAWRNDSAARRLGVGVGEQITITLQA